MMISEIFLRKDCLNFRPMRRLTRVLQKAARVALARLDAWFNALYTWRYNPLYHSGALVVACFLVLLATGLYLLLFYRIGSPYASVARITDQALTGRWIRTLHRYVSDLAVAAMLVHAVRMFVQGRSWGPRALAWVSGVVLAFVFFVCGWTGYVMVWDGQAHLLAAEGARLFDALPIFSEPISRAFIGDDAVPPAFFFLNLFAHIALPVGVALILWIHVSRLARSYLMPPKPLLWGMVGLFTAASVIWPMGMDAPADLLRLPGDVSLDLFYGFWLPASLSAGAGWVWLAFLAVMGASLAVPLFQRPPKEKAPLPSVVNARFCTGCEQCYHDCPYEAIDMVPRSDGRDGFVAWVNDTKCVSCGICSASCAPMGVGPPQRTGRDQISEVKAFLERARPGADDVVLVACANSAAGGDFFLDAPVYPVSCTGSLHTSVLEYLVRAGAGGVMVVACPPRDCWNREGVKWLEERVDNGREAELKPRVDRRRIRIVYAAEGESLRLAAELHAYRQDLTALDRAQGEDDIVIDVLCEVPEVSVAEEAAR
ncbi:MAG TPA: cytochrome b N-terminal domain-containing protein [Longimicrobiales bacterium]|nr:cytochrome b N-terminal domain-containing protein [Longimicrobiales bacterium]